MGVQLPDVWGSFPPAPPSTPRAAPNKANNCRTASFQLSWRVNPPSVSWAAVSSAFLDPHNSIHIHLAPSSTFLFTVLWCSASWERTVPFFFFNDYNVFTNPNEILFWDPGFWLQVASSFWSCLHPGSSLLNFLFSLERQRVSPATHRWIPVNLSLSLLTAWLQLFMS